MWGEQKYQHSPLLSKLGLDPQTLAVGRVQPCADSPHLPWGLDAFLRPAFSLLLRAAPGLLVASHFRSPLETVACSERAAFIFLSPSPQATPSYARSMKSEPMPRGSPGIAGTVVAVSPPCPISSLKLLT